MLSGEGLIAISDRRGTFVAESLPEPFASPSAAVPRAGQETQSLVATVGIVASVHPDPDPETYAAQWQLQVLQGCEHRLEQALGGDG